MLFRIALKHVGIHVVRPGEVGGVSGSSHSGTPGMQAIDWYSHP